MNKFLTIKEVAEALSVNYMHAYYLVTNCKHCKKSLTSKSKDKQCDCTVKKPFIQSHNIGKSIKNEYRVTEENLEKYLKESEL